MSKQLKDISNEQVALEVYECSCGFHVGLDATYMEQVEDCIEVNCPSCKGLITSY